MDFNKFFESKSFRGLLIGLALLIIFLIAFRAGMSVGFRKADFSYRYGDNYFPNFTGQKNGFRGGLEGREYLNAHGLIGRIIKLDNGSLVIADRDGQEKIVLAQPDTAVAHFRDTIKFGDLKIDDFIIVIGDPNPSGQIEAKFIRVMPTPPAGQLQPQIQPPIASPAIPTSIIK